jgi:hypothetical protein
MEDEDDGAKKKRKKVSQPPSYYCKEEPDEKFYITDIVHSSVSLNILFAIPIEYKLSDIFNRFVTSEKYPCIQYKDNFKFSSTREGAISQIKGDVRDTEGIIVYSNFGSPSEIEIDQRTSEGAQFYTTLLVLTNWKLSIDSEIKNFISKLTGNTTEEITVENIQGEYKQESISEALTRMQEGRKSTENQLEYKVGEFKKTSGIPIKIFRVKRVGQKSSFYVPNFNLKLYILQDILMNATKETGGLRFADMIIDESSKPTKESTYIYASPDGKDLDDSMDKLDNLLKCSVTVKQIKKAQSSVKTVLTKIGEILDEDSYFTQFRIIFAENNEEEKYFRERIKKLIYYYDEHQSEIEDEYENEISGIVHRKRGQKKDISTHAPTSVQEVKVKKKFGGRAAQVDPDIYGGMSRKCQGSRSQPSILCKVEKPFISKVPRGETGSFTEVKHTSEIPRSDTQLIHPFPPQERGDGYVQYVLECKEEGKGGENKHFIYMAKNGVPCCSASTKGREVARKNSIDDYYKGTVARRGYGAYDYEYKSMAILDDGLIGVAPESISNLLFKFPTLKRMGVGNGHLEECVVRALEKIGHNTGIPDVDSEKDFEYSISRIEATCGMDIIIFTGESDFLLQNPRRGTLLDLKHGIDFHRQSDVNSIILYHNFQAKGNREQSYELIFVEKTEDEDENENENKYTFSREEISPIMELYSILYPYRYTQKLENVIGQDDGALLIEEKDGTRSVYKTVQRIPYYGVPHIRDAGVEGGLVVTGKVQIDGIDYTILKENEKIPEQVGNDLNIREEQTNTVMEFAKFTFSRMLERMRIERDNPYTYPEILEEIDRIDLFLLDKNYDYPIEKIINFEDGDKFVSGDKIIVTSDEMVRNLRFYLKQSLFIDRDELVGYFKRKNLDPEMVGFFKRPNEKILKGLESMKLLVFGSRAKDALSEGATVYNSIDFDRPYSKRSHFVMMEIKGIQNRPEKDVFVARLGMNIEEIHRFCFTEGIDEEKVLIVDVHGNQVEGQGEKENPLQDTFVVQNDKNQFGIAIRVRINDVLIPIQRR